MRAVYFEKYGEADVLKMGDLPNPLPEADEILIEVAYAGVNPVDWKVRQGHMQELLTHELPIIPGWDAAGTVISIGNNVSQFSTGDRVFAYCRKPLVKMGAYAERIAVSESAAAKIPETMDFIHASTVPLVALTAWQALFVKANLREGQSVMIHGGAGGVGGYAIQFAKICGARVFSSASSSNAAYLKELGVDRFIDYRNESVSEVLKTEVPDGLDVNFDCVGGKTLSESYSLVKSGGALVSIVEPPDESKAKQAGIQAGFHFVEPSGEQLKKISMLISQGKVRTLPVEVFPLAEVKQALELNETRHVRGKLTLKIK